LSRGFFDISIFLALNEEILLLFSIQKQGLYGAFGKKSLDFFAIMMYNDYQAEKEIMDYV
jgi:hypothetical protein